MFIMIMNGCAMSEEKKLRSETEADNMVAILDDVAKRDSEACSFLRHILDIAAVWDDLIDRDCHVNDCDINRAFELALVALPSNTFYMRHLSLLHPLIVNSITNWHIATTMERQDRAEMREVSFVLRSSYADLFVMVARILSGRDFAHALGMRVRRFVHDEGISEYLSALKDERDKREEVD